VRLMFKSQKTDGLNVQLDEERPATSYAAFSPTQYTSQFHCPSILIPNTDRLTQLHLMLGTSASPQLGYFASGP
jgi:hypothetical protein